jgi:hypothetical protein
MRMHVQCLCTDLLFIQDDQANSFKSCHVHNIPVSVLPIIHKGGTLIRIRNTENPSLTNDQILKYKKRCMKHHFVVLESIIPYRQIDLGDTNEVHRTATPQNTLQHKVRG